MEIEKKILDDIDSCYAVMNMKINGENSGVFASESMGGCYYFNIEDGYKKNIIWNDIGGTMSLIALPNEKNSFLATQKFYPGFDAAESEIIKVGLREDGEWERKTIVKLPYAHRFDILKVKDKLYIVCVTLCKRKKGIDDWQSNGEILVGEFFTDRKIKLEPIKTGITRSHGYFKLQCKGLDRFLVTADEGVFLVSPPLENDEWKIENILNLPTSDVAAIDIDEDGEKELMTIEPFHGNHIKIYKNIDKNYKEVYEYKNPIEFGHVVWGGYIGGKPTFIGGGRGLEKELFYIQYDRKNKKFNEKIIDKYIGPSNVSVINCRDKDIVLCAARESGQAIAYIIKN